MQFWSYKIVVGDVGSKFEEELTQLGRDTWECCGVTLQPGGKIACVMKRELTANPRVGSVKVATRKTEPYVPGMPAGTED